MQAFADGAKALNNKAFPHPGGQDVGAYAFLNLLGICMCTLISTKKYGNVQPTEVEITYGRSKKGLFLRLSLKEGVTEDRKADIIAQSDKLIMAIGEAANQTVKKFEDDAINIEKSESPVSLRFIFTPYAFYMAMQKLVTQDLPPTSHVMGKLAAAGHLMERLTYRASYISKDYCGPEKLL